MLENMIYYSQLYLFYKEGGKQMITPLKKETKPKQGYIKITDQIIPLEYQVGCHNKDCGWKGIFKDTLFDYVNVEKTEIDTYCPNCGFFMFSYLPKI